MKPIFKICKTGSDSIKVVGLELDDHQYSDTLVDQTGTFRYTDTVTINILESLNQNEKVIDLKYDINEHKQDDIEDASDFEFPRDGIYRIHHIILPTLDWYNEVLGNRFNLNDYEEIYVYDNGLVFKMTDSGFKIINIEDIPFINPCLESTLTSDIQYTFSTAQLQECYYKFCKNYFNTICNTCDEDTTLIKNRDLLWMSINIIRYLLDLGRLFEAQKIVEKLNKCSGICHNTKRKITNVGCGCS